MQISIESIIHVMQSHLNGEAQLQVIDESVLHEGHAGHDPNIALTHVAVDLTWGGFESLRLVERQRMINTWLADFFKAGLHSVRYNLKTPDEV